MGRINLSLSFCVIVLLAGMAGAGEQWLQRDSIKAVWNADSVDVECTVVNPKNHEVTRDLAYTITDYDRHVILGGSQKFPLKPGPNVCKMTSDGRILSEQIPLTLLTFALGGPGDTETVAVSVMTVMPQVDAALYADQQYIAGSKASLTVSARDSSTHRPLAGADVTVTLAVAGKTLDLYAGKTPDNGVVNVPFEVPTPESTAEVKLQVLVQAAGLAEEQLVSDVRIVKSQKVLLTTDKPIYQPGQAVHMRTLCLVGADLKPVCKKPLVFEVADGRGNKVFKREVDTGEFGVASAVFSLADEVNLGTYRITATLEGFKAEKDVEVQKYVLPKFTIKTKTDRAYYELGELVKGDVQADYTFGKPVPGGHVVVAMTPPGGKKQELQGTLDDNGHWSFETAVSDQMLSGDASRSDLVFETQVTDKSGNQLKKTMPVTVSKAPLDIFAVPECGALVNDIVNRVYLVVTRPDGTPVPEATVRVDGGMLVDPATQLTTDSVGIATVLVTVNSQKFRDSSLNTHVQDKEGHRLDKQLQVNLPGDVRRHMIVRTDKSLYQPGEVVHVQVLVPKPDGQVTVDIAQQGQALAARSWQLAGDKAQVDFPLPDGARGIATVRAYMSGQSSEAFSSDGKVIFVNPPESLDVQLALDSETYRPGSKARLNLLATDRTGHPAAAAIGLAIVDEAVFVLQDAPFGKEKEYFAGRVENASMAIRGFDLPQLIRANEWTDEQQRAATVLLATARTAAVLNRMLDLSPQRQANADRVIAQRYMSDLKTIHAAVLAYLKKHDGKVKGDLPKALFHEKLLAEDIVHDAWGSPYDLDFAKAEEFGGYFEMLSYGPDGVKGTADDISPDTDWGRENLPAYSDGQYFGGRVPQMRGVHQKQRHTKHAQVMSPELTAAKSASPPLPMVDQSALEWRPASGADMDGAPHVREYFPETLLFEPALITDEQGKAALDIDLADSITTWRMAASASSRTGALGSAMAPLRVFQDFFVDINLPAALTQHDAVSIPVTVFNYLDGAQDVRLKFEAGDWFKLAGAPEQTVTLKTNEVRCIHFPIEVLLPGKHKLTVFAYGSKLQDAIRRDIEVEPDGEQQTVTHGGRLEGTVSHQVSIPATAIPGANKLLVRIYPGVFSQLIDGVESMLRMPHGCFEQTSSSTYPNVLILQYLQSAGTANAAAQRTADEYIGVGYQRLVSFEVKDGGFSLFGHPPTDVLLTAMGLKEFCDMAKVHYVDPALIERTRTWLLRAQKDDGSWDPTGSYYSSYGRRDTDRIAVTATAYVLDALINSGETRATPKAVDFILSKPKALADAYTLALVANALVAWDAKDARTRDVLKQLYELRKQGNDTAWWGSDSTTVMHGYGRAATVETTALAVCAFVRADVYADVLTPALVFLLNNKCHSGDWGSTQATVLTLKAFLEAMGKQGGKTNATVVVTLNGAKVNEITVTPENSDTMHLIDISDRARTGENIVSLVFIGEGSLLYQVAGSYYMPWADEARAKEPFQLTVTYDKADLAVNETVTATMKARNVREEVAPTVMLNLGIPPGFELDREMLDGLVKGGGIQRYEARGRNLVVYLDKIDPRKTFEMSYTLRAVFPMRAQTPLSRVYEYYNPETCGVSRPQLIRVR